MCIRDRFGTLYNKALEGDDDCGGLLAYNYFSGEHITGFEEGRPLFVRMPESRFNLANFMRVHLFTALGALKTGLDILLKDEGVKLDKILGHGGLFKTCLLYTSCHIWHPLSLRNSLTPLSVQNKTTI